MSVVNGEPVSTIIQQSGPKTLALGLSAAFLTYALAIPLGVLARRAPQHAVRPRCAAGRVLCMGIPNFFLAVLLIQFFAVQLGWLPVAGPGDWKHLVLPAVVLCVESVAINLRLVRSSRAGGARLDYVRTLRAKGLSDRRILWVHAFRNALPPVIALAGISSRTLLGYTLIVETIFRWPGLGYQLVQGDHAPRLRGRPDAGADADGAVIFFNFLADVGQQLIDPRVRDRIRGN